MSDIEVQIRREPNASDLPLPSYATAGAAGLDLYAAIDEDVTVAPGERKQVSTGIRLALPYGYEGQIRPRSGLALRSGIGFVNSPGTIDSDYRGVVAVLVINWGDESLVICRGDRIAQLVVAPVSRVVWQELGDEILPPTARHEGGFGHTGVA